MRHFLMTTKGLSEDEAISLCSITVDFGITQVVDGNWGVHAIARHWVRPPRARVVQSERCRASRTSTTTSAGPRA